MSLNNVCELIPRRREGSGVTSDIVAHSGSEAAPPGDNDPIKDLSADAARLHSDDWSAGG